MKKKYINPSMEVVKVDAPQIMAGSPGIGGKYGGATPEAHEFDFDFDD
ncbi:MAG: hypothetical protein IJ069_02525 [Prevotella sp.]|nr:hypothetical protein [Prevotella sp.]MBQ8152542.1 hypothetical protein [Prevotella sp.]MBQ8713677.1 hypothetical protein [Prevotella sp.]